MAGKTYPYSIKHDFDGAGVGHEEELSVKKVTRAVEAAGGAKQSDSDAKKAWKQKVIDRLNEYGFKQDADYLTQHWGNDDWLYDGDAFGDVYSGKVWGGSDPYHNHVWGTSLHNPPSDRLAGAMEGNDANGQHIKGKERLMHDSSWQQVTSVNRKHSDGSTRTPNPITDNYAVARKTGQLVKVDYDNGQTHWMPSDDYNGDSDLGGSGAHTGNNGELSEHAASGYGGSNVNMSYAGQLGSNPGYLTNEEWDEIGKGGYTNPNGTIPNNPDQLAAARKAKGVAAPAASSSSGGGGPLLLYGYWNLFHGSDAKCVGFANPQALHAAGGWMDCGSNNTFVGCSYNPVSRVDDGTSDGKAAVTGGADCLIGGSPSKTPGPAP